MPPGPLLGSARVTGSSSPCNTSMPAHVPNTPGPHPLTPPLRYRERLSGMQGGGDLGKGSWGMVGMSTWSLKIFQCP